MSKYSENMPPSLKGAVEWMQGYIEPNSLVLDFGCSTGYFGAYLKAEKNCQVYGIEISKDIDEARKVLDGVYSFDLDGEWPETVFERTYDYLFFGDVIEHLKYPKQVLEKAGKLLKKHGKIFISTPNIAHISTRLELMGGNFEYESMGILDETHLKYFTKRSLQSLAAQAGYKIEAFDYSANDYPKEIIEKLLQKLDLTPGPKFWEMTKTIEARAFQFKLVMSKARSSAVKKTLNLPVPQKPEQFRDDWVSDLNNQIEGLKKHADEQAKIIEHLSNETKRLEHEASMHKRRADSSIERRIKNTARKVFKRKK